MAAKFKTLVQRGILVAGDANVSLVRSGFAPAMGKPPASPVLPQRSVSAVVQPSWRHVDEQRAALRAGRSGSDAGDLASRRLASITRQAVQFGWPTAEGRDTDRDTTDRMSCTTLLTARATGAGNATRLAERCLAGRDEKSATASLVAGRGTPSVSTRGLADLGYCQAHDGNNPIYAHGTRIPPQASV
jgi:hypothetical protein